MSEAMKMGLELAPGPRRWGELVGGGAQPALVHFEEKEKEFV